MKAWKLTTGVKVVLPESKWRPSNQISELEANGQARQGTSDLPDCNRPIVDDLYDCERITFRSISKMRGVGENERQIAVL